MNGRKAIEARGYKEPEEIVCMTYDQWEEKHIQMARCEAKIRQRRWDEKHKADRERRIYFCNQKILGGIAAVVSVIPFLVTRDLSSLLVGSVLLIPALHMIVTDKMVIVNDYYWENGGAEQWED